MPTEERETWAQEVARLRREIAERQARLQFLVLGDQTKMVTVPHYLYSHQLFPEHRPKDAS
jgi:hypothetical protein